MCHVTKYAPAKIGECQSDYYYYYYYLFIYFVFHNFLQLTIRYNTSILYLHYGAIFTLLTIRHDSYSTNNKMQY